MDFTYTFILFLILAVCSVVIGLVVTRINDHWSTGKKIVTIPVGLIGALVVAVVVSAFVSTQMHQTPAGSTPSPTPTETTPSPTPTETTPSPTPTETTPSPTPTETTPSPTPARTSEFYLADDLQPVRIEKEDRPGNCTGGCTGFGGGAARIKGTTYPNSYLMEVAPDGRRSTAVWNLARSCTELNMTVGINDDRAPNAQVTFTLSVDGAPPESLATVGLSEPFPIDNKSVAGVGQMEIAAYVSGPAAPDEVPIVLGDARVTCKSASLGDIGDS